jgi:hypothetical protein
MYKVKLRTQVGISNVSMPIRFYLGHLNELLKEDRFGNDWSRTGPSHSLQRVILQLPHLLLFGREN